MAEQNGNGKKYVTWQGLLTLIGTSVVAAFALLWSFHCSAKSELQTQINAKVEKERYASDITWIKETLQDIKNGKIVIEQKEKR